jgi:GrpB-like predicted nucleotidyltransferase (UPF0157 family)
MTQKYKPVMYLIGELRQREAEWSIPELRDLFPRLIDISAPGAVTRVVRYFGESGGRMEVCFFGIQIDSIESIPEGMVGLELDEASITLMEPGGEGVHTAWKEPLTWNWLDRSIAQAPVGEFTARVPFRWTSQKTPPPLDFILATNSYFEKCKSADDDIHLVVYDPQWPVQFEEMAKWLRKVIPPEILLRIEHFGSTAIPDMSAKPVIDILVEVPSFSAARRNLIPIFNKPECEYWWESDHMVFYQRKELMGTRTHHIHIAPAGHSFWERIAFRDYLRTHPDDARRYAALKYKLAAIHTTDREAYTDAKGTFVNEITEKALRKGKH